MKRNLSWVKRVLYSLAVLIFLLHLIPYLIPVPADDQTLRLPFAESRTAAVDGVSLHYRVWMPEEITTESQQIVFVHGQGGSTFSWRHQTEDLLEAGHVVLAVDLPGFGYSDRKRGLIHSQAERARLTWSLIDMAEEIDLERPIHLAGHSMGAGVVSEMAVRRPEKTASLVYVGGSVLYGGNRGGFLTRYPPAGRWLQVLLHHVFLTESRIGSFLASAYGREPEPSEVKGYLEPLRLPGTTGALLDMVNTSTSTPPGTLELIDELEIPLLMIWGRNDSWVPAADGMRLEELIALSRLEIMEGAYHCPMETHPDEFNRLLLDWLTYE